MSDQLYREADVWFGPAEVDIKAAAMVAQLQEWGWVVPIEVDYEAAKTCESCEGSGVMPEPHGLGMVEQLSCPDCRGTGQWINDEAVRYVLSQALGIGGDDG